MAEWLNFDYGSKSNCIENSGKNELINGYVYKNDVDDVKWGDCDDNLRGLFDQILMVLLRGLYAKNGSRPIPALLDDGREVDLFKLFCLVRDRGGFRAVSEDRLWGLIAEKLGFECALIGSLKLIYYKYLDELDQWLNRLTSSRNSEIGVNECGGNLGLLSLELVNRLKDFSTDDKEVIRDGGTRNDNKQINVVKATLPLPVALEGAKVHNVEVELAVGDRGGLCERRVFAGKAKQSVNDGHTTYRKRRRDMFGETLSWMTKVAKNPCNPSIGALPGCSRGKGSGYKDFLSIALSLREARLRKRYTTSIDQQSASIQKKHKMHPSMYEDDVVSSHCSAEGLRCSERLLTMANTPCQCCKASAVDKCTSKIPSNSYTENRSHKQELVNADLSDKKRVVVSSVEDAPVENYVLVGPRYQAEVPLWTGITCESDSKWLGTQIWTPDLEEKNSCRDIKLLGKGRLESCACRLPGSVECYRFHIAENRIKLRRELGLAFFQWNFGRMGEEVSLSWLPKEENRFKEVMRSNKTFLGKAFIARKTRMELVSYYFNVFLIKRRSYQNRVTPKKIDSDDDESEFGSVGEAYGYNAVKVRGSEPLKCSLNEQVLDLD